MNLFQYIYFHGPKKFGFWNGIDSVDACSEITKVPSKVWSQQLEACNDLLMRDYEAYMIGVGLVTSGLFLWKLTDFLMLQYTFRSIGKKIS